MALNVSKQELGPKYVFVFPHFHHCTSALGARMHRRVLGAVVEDVDGAAQEQPVFAVQIFVRHEDGREDSRQSPRVLEVVVRQHHRHRDVASTRREKAAAHGQQQATSRRLSAAAHGARSKRSSTALGWSGGETSGLMPNISLPFPFR